MVGLFNVYMYNKQRIKTLKGVSKLMEDLWISHRSKYS